MHTNLCFATPIYITKLVEDDLDNVQKELTEVYLDHSDKDMFADPWDNGRLQTSNGILSIDISSLYKTECFIELIKKNTIIYLQSIGQEYIDHKIDSVWMTRMVKHSYSHVHSHYPHSITGVYYYKTNGNDGNIVFENPLVNYAWTSNVGMKTLLPDNIPVTPEVGKMILFPSWLRHGVETNLTDNERISISFNLTLL
jgi:uncharacterized protein (TIGR02466 family)